MDNLLLNTKECAYDAFGNELKIGDKVAFAVSRWTGDYIMCVGTVVGWSQKMVKVQCTDGATNSDKPAVGYPGNPVGHTASRKPDKIIKLSLEAKTSEIQKDSENKSELFCGNGNSTDWARVLY